MDFGFPLSSATGRDLKVISPKRYNDYCAVRELLKWLRAEVIRDVELATLKDKATFILLRKRLLGLFGEGWGAEKKLKNIFDDEHQNGQARFEFEKCRKGDANEH